jgi:hypothetical protein
MVENQFAYLIAAAGYGINIFVLFILSVIVWGLSWISRNGQSRKGEGQNDKKE